MVLLGSLLTLRIQADIEDAGQHLLILAPGSMAHLLQKANGPLYHRIGFLSLTRQGTTTLLDA